jgi:hypothetical protein
LEITRVKIRGGVNATKDYFIKAIRVSKGGQPEFTPNLILKFNEETSNHEIYIMQGQNLVFRGDYFPDGSLQNGVLEYPTQISPSTIKFLAMKTISRPTSIRKR